MSRQTVVEFLQEAAGDYGFPTEGTTALEGELRQEAISGLPNSQFTRLGVSEGFRGGEALIYQNTVILMGRPPILFHEDIYVANFTSMSCKDYSHEHWFPLGRSRSMACTGLVGFYSSSPCAE
jgi:hypothetical protein